MRVQRLTPINARASSIIDAIVEAFNFLWRSFLSFLRRHDIKLMIRSSYHFYFYCESKKTMEKLNRQEPNIFVRRDDSFPEANPIVQFLEMAKGISDKIEVRLEHVDCLRVNAKSILPPWRDREITRLLVTSPMGMLDPRCEAILRYHASLTTYHCERSLDNLKPVEPYATSYTVIVQLFN